jgi:predicted unusual protein kinase regulating ubiquinone biosynthesis (AarF/ABC1/UbiB family)
MTELGATPDGRRFYALRGVRNNVYVNDVPRNAVTRAAKLAGLPIGLAGRTALGVGKRIGGRPAEIVAEEIQRRTADQIFRVLGELKGGAMKLGQALSIFEAALPPEIAGPYRTTLTRLQESAPPLPARTVHQVLTQELGEYWRSRFVSFEDVPAAAASIGQVHQAVWHDGRRVAVKIQYPGAGRALIGDFNQLSRAGRLFGMLMPGLEVKPLLDELRDRVSEELDYRLEAGAQRAFAAAYRDDPDIYVPDVVTGTGQVLVSEWMDGIPLSKISSDGSKEERDRAGILLVRFLFSGPARAGLLHADPHPGNFRLLADGRLGVLDFGAVDRLPDGLPPFFGRLLRIMHTDEPDVAAVERELRAYGFLRPGIEVDLDALRTFLAPMAEPSKVDSFKFNREWLRGEAARVTDVSTSNITRKFNLPPSYVLIHRVSTAGIGVLCQLECEGEFRAEVLRWVPGYLDLPALPHRGALLGEGPGALPGVLRAEDRRHERGHLVPSLLGGPVAAAVGDLLGGDQRQGTVGRDPFGQFDRFPPGLAVVHDVVDQPDAGGPGRVDRVAGQQHLQGQGAGHPLGQQHRAARPGHQPALDLGHAEARRRARDDQVAGQQELEAPGQGPAFGRADQRLARRGLGDAAQAAAGEGGHLTVQERLEVHPGGERAARSGEHPGAQFGGRVKLVDRVADADRHRPVQGVAGLRPVDRDDLYRAVALDQYLVAHVLPIGMRLDRDSTVTVFRPHVCYSQMRGSRAQ